MLIQRGNNNLEIEIAEPFSSSKSIYFNNTDDYINVGNLSALDGASNASFSGWCKYEAAAPNGFLNSRFLMATKLSTGPNQGGSGILVIQFLNTRGLMFRLFAAGGGFGSFEAYYPKASLPSFITDGSWFHYAFVFDGAGLTNSDKIKLYINGGPVTLSFELFPPDSTGTDFPTTLGTGYFNGVIGGNAGNDFRTYEGNIDEFAIFNSSLTQADVTSIYGTGVPNDISSLNPSNWWRMGDGDTFPTITDHGINSNDGTMVNMTAGRIETDVPT
jgi:hypothetical protein